MSGKPFVEWRKNADISLATIDARDHPLIELLMERAYLGGFSAALDFASDAVDKTLCRSVNEPKT